MVRSSQLQSAIYNVDYFQRPRVCRLCWAPDATRYIRNSESKRPRSPTTTEESNVLLLDKKYASEVSSPEKKNGSLKNKDLSTKILSCLGIDVKSSVMGEFPKKICEVCTKTVNKFYKFKVSCQRADKRLKQIYSQQLVKPELDLLEVEIKTEQTGESFSDTYNECDSVDSVDNQPLFKLKSKIECVENEHQDENLPSPNRKENSPKKETVNSNLELNSINPNLNSERLSKGARKARSQTYCNICHTEFGEQFAEHNRSAHGIDERGYNCFGCEKRFPSRKSRLCHETKFCKGLKEGYGCGGCGRRLGSRRAYEAHQREHRAGRAPGDVGAGAGDPFRCAPCGKCFKTRANLRQHEAAHRSKKNFVCEICGRVFNRRDYLRKHIHTHTGQKHYICPHCGFRATQKSSLTVHIRKHTGERPFGCDVCGQRCVSSSNLLAHRRRHEGHKNFECAICGKKFGYKLSLDEHMASTHERLRTYACRLCGATYSRQRGLRRHARVKHGANYDGCGATEDREKRNDVSVAASNSELQNGAQESSTIDKDKDVNSSRPEGFLTDLNAERQSDGTLKNLNLERVEAGNLSAEQCNGGISKDLLNDHRSERVFMKSFDRERHHEQGLLKVIAGGVQSSKLELERDDKDNLRQVSEERLGEESRPNQWIFLGPMLGLSDELKPINK